MKEWSSVHLHYAEPWENFLSKGIAPFIEKIMCDQLAERFFFIRYWHRGPHIRLRIKSKRENSDELKKIISAYFVQFFKENPSDPLNGVNNKEQIKKETDISWLPNNSFHFIPYSPEIERYGGEVAMLIAEKQFEASSKVILSIIKESEAWNYNKAMAKAIQLHLAFAYATGMDLAEAALFYSKIFKIWLPKACTSTEAFDDNKGVILDAFHKNYEVQQETILPFFEKLWTAMKNQEKFEQNWLMEWISDTIQMRKELTNIQNENKFTRPKWYTPESVSEVGILNQERWSVYDSYIHMTNNRLGILNRDEGYLGYIMMQGFLYLKGKM